MYCFNKAKASTAYNQQATTNIISILRRGKLPDNSKCEDFLDRKRIPRGGRMDFPCLPHDGLCNIDVILHLHEEAERYWRIRNGCHAQYQGKRAFRGMQTMNAQHDGLNNEHLRQRPNDQKKQRGCRGGGCGCWWDGLETPFMITTSRKPSIWFLIWLLNMFVQTLKETHTIL